MLGYLLDLIAPRICAICGRRLDTAEETICTICNLDLPRTNYHKDAYNNELARLFWRILPIERAAAMFFYVSHSPASNVIYKLKYGHNPQTAVDMGRVLANEIIGTGFFEGIDVIVPVTLARNRQRMRGYNQSEMIACGISEVTHLPVIADAAKRATFKESQTMKSQWQRRDNVEGSFTLHKGERLKGKHILIVDDVVTTGATITAFAKELMKAGDVKISVACLGYSRA